MNFNKIIDDLLKEDFSDQQIRKYIGDYQDAYFAYSNHEAIRNNAASGGVVTTILLFLLNNDMIDGAVVCRSRVVNDEVKAEFFIAKNKAELMKSQGSKYITTRFSFEALPLINSFDGRLAVVTLPCDAKILFSYCEKHPAIREKIKCIITLFCGHLSTADLTNMVIDKLRPSKNAKLINFRFCSGHWRGHLTAEFSTNNIFEKPKSFYSDYQNLFFFSEKKCLHCYDHTGYFSDISIGDIWLQEMKNNPIKHSAIITKTNRGAEIIKNISKKQDLLIREQPINIIAESQSRSLKIHYNISARAKAGRLLGEKIKDEVNEKVRIVDFIVAFLLMMNYKITTKKWGIKIVSWLPRPIIKLYLYFIKGLEIL
jgi:coenzyme F420 hydrogenase subunit beta